MTETFNFDSGKGQDDENFPVGSVLIAPRHRPLVFAFYRVARMADDVADHPTATPEQKLERLDVIEATLLGQCDAVPQAATLRTALLGRDLDARHILDLLKAFRLDVTKARYEDWADLMDYCRYSAAPVGRFMLDVHGESQDTWPASDALCAALQVINHLQDCAKDYRDIHRVYIPRDALGDADLEALGAERASPALRTAVANLAVRTHELLQSAVTLGPQVRDIRLALEIGVIRSLAVSLNRRLLVHDPLCERVHHRPFEALGLALSGAIGILGGRMGLGRSAKLRHS